MGFDFGLCRFFFFLEIRLVPSASHSSCVCSYFSDFIPYIFFLLPHSPETKLPKFICVLLMLNTRKKSTKRYTWCYIRTAITFTVIKPDVGRLLFAKACCVAHKYVRHTPTEMKFLNQIMFILYISFQTHPPK